MEFDLAVQPAPDQPAVFQSGLLAKNLGGGGGGMEDNGGGGERDNQAKICDLTC